MRNAPATVALIKRAAIPFGIVAALLAFVYGIFLAYGGNATGGATWLLVSIGSFSASIAYYGVSLARKTAREQNTISFIKDYNDKASTDKAFDFLRKMRAKNLSPPYFDSKESDERKSLLALMNRLEALAIGINFNIYEERIIRAMFSQEVRTIYKITKPIIALIREEEAHPKAFCEFEKLAKRLADAA